MSVRGDGDSDARAGSGERDHLARLVDAVWDQDIVEESARGPSTDTPEYLALPNRDRAQVLLPRDHVAGAATYLTAGRRLRSSPQAIVRRFARLAVLAGALGLSGPSSDVKLTDRREAVESFHAVLAEHLAQPVGSVAFSVRGYTPNWKPTFAAMRPDGTLIGYGKVGWDVGSRARVAAEAQALRHWRGQPTPGLEVPACLADYPWRNRRIIVVSPIPDRARRFRRSRAAPTPLVRVELERGGDGARPADSLLRGYLETVPTEVLGRRDVSEAVDRFGDRYGARELVVGYGHGDWVPWNVAKQGSVLWAWDWEHALSEAAIGIDIVHWHALVATHVAGRGIHDAVRVGRQAALAQFRDMGVPAGVAEAVTTLGMLRLVSLRREFLSWDGGMEPLAAVVCEAIG